ncbi:MAG: lipoyl domain-containing protein, partial [Gaiellaceae bacterium]
MPDVAMPRLSDSMEEGTILKWLRSDGDEISKGDELVEIETDKANMTYEADEEGVLEIVAQEGDTLPVGETIARIGEGGGGGEEEAAEEEAEEPQGEAEEAEEEEPGREEKDGGEDGDEKDSGGNGRREERPEPAPATAEAADGDGDGRVK